AVNGKKGGGVHVELEAKPVTGLLADGVGYQYWTYNGTVPGPMIRVRQGDTVELTLKQGDASAQYRLGYMYENGLEAPRDEAKAVKWIVKWFRKAAEQGDVPAQYVVGAMYANGYGVPRDDAEAVKWYRKAAEQGHASALSALGLSYANGRGVPRDEAEAVKW